MPNEIRLTAVPQAPAPNRNGSSGTQLTATVFNSETGAPVISIPVQFSTTVPYADITIPSSNTNNNGVAQTFLYYPRPNPLDLSGVKVIQVFATIAGGVSAGVLVNYYDLSLTVVELFNVTPRGGGIFDANAYSIRNGIEAMIYLPPNIQPGSQVTFYWGSFSYKRGYNGGPLFMVFAIADLFEPSLALVNGTYAAWYTIQDIAGNLVAPYPQIVYVADSPYTVRSLLAPILPYTGINLERALAGVNVTIPAAAQPELLNWQLIRVYLNIVTYGGQLLKTVLVGTKPLSVPLQDITQLVNSNDLLGYDGVYGDFYYEALARRNNTGPAPVSLLSLITRVYIDTVAPGI